MPRSYEPEFKKLVRLHMDRDEPIKASPKDMMCQKPHLKMVQRMPDKSQSRVPNEFELMKENQRLRKKLEEAKKETLFLKK